MKLVGIDPAPKKDATIWTDAAGGVPNGTPSVAQVIVPIGPTYETLSADLRSTFSGSGTSTMAS